MIQVCEYFLHACLILFHLPAGNKRSNRVFGAQPPLSLASSWFLKPYSGRWHTALRRCPPALCSVEERLLLAGKLRHELRTQEVPPFPSQSKECCESFLHLL